MWMRQKGEKKLLIKKCKVCQFNFFAAKNKKYDAAAGIRITFNFQNSKKTSKGEKEIQVKLDQLEGM